MNDSARNSEKHSSNKSDGKSSLNANTTSSATDCSGSCSGRSTPLSPAGSVSPHRPVLNSPHSPQLDSSDFTHHLHSDMVKARNELNLLATSSPAPSGLYPSIHTSCPPLFMAPSLFKPVLTNNLSTGCPLNLSMSNTLVNETIGKSFDPPAPRSGSGTDSFPTTQTSCETPSPNGMRNNKNIQITETKNDISDASPDYRNPAKRPSPGLLCVVCGDTSSGKHYGILACNGCSGFFKRSVRRKLIYRCQAGTGSCIIDKQHRNQCQACRLKKCIQMGMNKDAVQNERQPRNTATIRPETLLNDRESERLLREGVAATVNALFTANSGIHNMNNNQSFQFSIPNHLAPSLDPRENISSSVERNGEDIKSETAKESTRAMEHFDYTNNIAYSTTNNPLTSSFGHPSPSEQSFSAILPCQESVYETAARLLFMAVKWAKNLPSFASLTFRDQVILLEESWSELFLLCAIQWCLPLENCQLFSPSTGNDNPIINGERMLDLNVLSEIFNRFKSNAVDPGEFACLKALSLFKPEARGLKDVPRIESMQDQAQIMLLQHEKARNPTSPTRFGRLLLLLTSLRLVSAERIGNIYFHRTIGNTPMEKLLCDMFKC